MADIDKANPLDAATISGFPSNERDSRAAIETILDLEHDGDGTTATGRHKFGRGSVTARDAITDWETGSVWINSDTTPNGWQVNVGTQAAPSWITIGAAVITTRGDIIRGDSAGAAERLALGTNRQLLLSDGTDVAWNDYAASDTAKGGIEIATQAEMETATSTALAVTPGRTQNHPGVAKAWGKFDIAGTLNASHNLDSVTDTGAGDWSPQITTDFSSVNYSVPPGFRQDAGTGTDRQAEIGAQAAGSFQLLMHVNGVLTDPLAADDMHFAAFGDQ